MLDSSSTYLHETRTRRSDPIEWLYQHKHPLTKRRYLSQSEYEASEIFCLDAMQFIAKYRTQSWDMNHGQKGNNTNIQYIHLPSLVVKKRFTKAMSLLHQDKLFIFDICLGGMKIKDAEKKYGLKKGAAKLIIKKRLHTLSHFYDLF